LPDIDQVTRDRGCRRHRRTDEMRPPSTPLPAFEVAIAGRSTALSRPEDVGVHAEAHRAAGVTPLKAGVHEDGVQALGLRLALDAGRPGHHHRPHLWVDTLAADH